MTTVGLLVRLEAKPGKEAEVEALLQAALPLVEEELATTVWFAFRLASGTLGIFDAFPDDAGRRAHLAGRLAAALATRAGELLSAPPAIEPLDVIAVKLPRG